MALKLATLCYVHCRGQTLMVHRIKKANDMHQGKWNGLGGKLEPGETPEECARREIREESGIEVEALTWKGLITFPGFSGEEDWYAWLFVAQAPENALEAGLIDSPEGFLAWVPTEKLLELNLWEGDRIFIPWLDQPGCFSAKFIYKEGRLVEHSVIFYR